MGRNKPGCCVDQSCDPEICVKIPSGLSCHDCVYTYRCSQLFGIRFMSRTFDFYPRRFVHAAAKT
jgi:hypothetical protein